MGITNIAPKILDPIPGGKYLVNAMDWVINWAKANSLWPLTYGTSCCAIEMMSSSMARYDIARFGSEVFRASPRQADLFIIAGTVTKKMAPAMVALWEQIPGPKYAIAMGACTISGGPFVYNNYSVVRGADKLIPVDVFIPGCPPRPEALFQGILTLRDKIRSTESSRSHWQEGKAREKDDGDRWAAAAQTWAELEKIKDEEMACARAEFKEKNPDYKSAFKPRPVPKEDLPALERTPTLEVGRSAEELYKTIQALFTDIQPFAASPSDTPDFVVSKENWLAFAKFAQEKLACDYLLDVTAVDWIDHFDVIAQFMSLGEGHKVFARCSLPKPENKDWLPELQSITAIYPAAEWKEREVYDMFGISFSDHPDLRRIFTEDDFEGWPLRKDFESSHIIKKPI
ncbi:MAG: NADH-quinone oxidoreductase subunit NuoB [Fibromonadaceae bacterium]|jgi:NADH-quinone oxidoreductase B subunit|nr:NADH-quinone oxidoreductase subunit NuoB [Fibromonadaceae bacterium]